MKILMMALFIIACGLFIAAVVIAEELSLKQRQDALAAEKAKAQAAKHQLFLENSRQTSELFKD